MAVGGDGMPFITPLIVSIEGRVKLPTGATSQQGVETRKPDTGEGLKVVRGEPSLGRRN